MAIDRSDDEQLPDLWWSVDPGDVNVGLTEWSHQQPIRSVHTNPNDCIDDLVTACGRRGLKLLVYERFQLYGDAMHRQQGSDFLTCQMIGAMRHICRRAGVPTVEYLAGHHKKLYKLPDYKPPRKPLNAWASYGHGGHAKDSECLGLYHIRRVTMKGRGY